MHFHPHMRLRAQHSSTPTVQSHISFTQYIPHSLYLHSCTVLNQAQRPFCMHGGHVTPISAKYFPLAHNILIALLTLYRTPFFEAELVVSANVSLVSVKVVGT